ncbi:unnamed protein product [Prunus armeniaca]
MLQALIYFQALEGFLKGQNCNFFGMNGAEVVGLEDYRAGTALWYLFCLVRALQKFVEVFIFVKTQTLLVLAFAEPNL